MPPNFEPPRYREERRGGDMAHSLALAGWWRTLGDRGQGIGDKHALSALFLANLANLAAGFESCAFIEINSAGVVYHS